jgi:N-acetyltransferase
LPDNKTESRQTNHTLEFGKISFKREVLRRHNRSDKNKEESQGPGAIICEEQAVPAVCGFRAIWVVPSRRRRGIGSQLMDAARYVLQAPLYILLALMLVAFQCLENSSLPNMNCSPQK